MGNSDSEKLRKPEREGQSTARYNMPAVAPLSAEERLYHIISVMRAMRGINHLILKESDPDVVIEKACAGLTQTLGYPACWIVRFDVTLTTPALAFGGGMDYGALLTPRLHGSQLIWPRVLRNALESPDPTWFSFGDPVQKLTDMEAAHLDEAVGICAPLSYRREIYGLIVAAIPANYAGDHEEREVFRDLATEIGFVLYKIEIERARESDRERLRMSEERFRGAFTLSASGMAMLSFDGTIHSVNNTFCQILGRTATELIGKDVADFTYPDDIQTSRENFALIRDGKVPNTEYEKRYLRSDGQIVWAHISLGLVRDRHGEPVYIVGQAVDITRRQHALQALRRSEEFTRAVLNSLSIQIGILDPDGTILSINDSWRDFVHRIGSTPPSEPGANFFKNAAAREDVDQDHAALVQDMVIRISSGETDYFETETHLLRNARPEYIFQLRITPYPEPAPRKVILAFEDITEKRRSEMALVRSESLMREAERVARIGAFVWHFSDNRFEFSEGWQRIHGTTAKRLYYEELMPIAHPEDRLRVQEALQGSLHGEMIYDIEHRILHQRTGEVRWLKSHGEVHRDAAGTALYLFGVVQDITSQRTTESDRTRLLAAMDQSAEIVFITGPAGKIAYVNQAFQSFTGLEKSAVVGRSAFSLQDQGVVDLPEKRILAHVVRGRIWSGPITYTHSANHRSILDASVTPVRGSEGRIEGFVAVLRDRTEEIRQAASQEHTGKLLALGTMATGIAHDFNNILQALLGFAEIVYESMSDDDPNVELMEEVLTSGERAAELVSQVLSFGRHTEVRPQPLSVQTMAKEAIKMMASLFPPQVELHSSIESNLPPVLADPVHIHQIVINLITNSLQALDTEPGRVGLEVVADYLEGEVLLQYPGSSPCACVRLTVRDNGPGMDEETRRRALEPYFTTKQNTGGSGIGLATVDSLVRQYKGAIALETAPGCGCRVDVYLPLIEEGESAREISSVGAPNTLAGNLRILMVDDERAVAQSLGLSLQKRGAEVTLCHSGAEAITALAGAAHPFDVVVTDMTMPEMSGLMLARHIRERDPRIPVILCSGYREAVEAHKASQAGIAAVLSKPVRASALIEAILQAIKR